MTQTQRGAVKPPEDGHQTQPHADTEEDAPSRKGAWFWALIAVLFLAIGGGIFAWLTFSGGDEQAQNAPQPPLVRVALVEQADRLEVRQSGFVRPLFEVQVASEVAGRIAELSPSFRLGSQVKAGDVLVQLDRDTFEADEAQARARLEQARAAVTEARITRDRAQELEDRGFGTEEQLQESILGVARAQAELAAARASITRTESNLDNATITAPFDALVTARTAAPGQIVQPGASLGTLVALEAAEVEMGLVPPDIALLGDLSKMRGAKVEIRGIGPDAPQLGVGVVSDVDPSIENRTRTTALVVRINDAFAPRDPRPLRVGELVNLILPAQLSDGNVLSLPVAALTNRDTVWTVEDGKLRRAQVQVLQRAEERALVLSNALDVGAPVMVSDLAAAFEGQVVRVANAEREADS
ncbi:efflux RND transporter periplasmic adaptor subunit [Marivita sp. S0852]|uniref:efflux RND transporter periplasmic adaptor subunit n=1 Tax=Marivita sp. S0852 TaxID=3373893 RepID=UPI00398246DF